MEIEIILLLLVAGLLSGVVNTLAGSGSVFTLSALLFIDMPVHIANGTNRLGAIATSITSLLTFRKHDKLPQVKQDAKWYIFPTVLGSIIGAVISKFVEAKTFENIILVLMVFMFFLVVLKPKRWLQETQEKLERKTLLNFFVLLAISIYAGFIQMGMGVLYLSAFVLLFKYSVVEGNMLKILLTLFMVVPAFFVFLYYDMVLWKEGLILAGGQAVGAFFATKFLLENKKAAVIVRYLLMIMILLAIGKLLMF
ncbi:MAG: sulfite exporter TauE/SafE family protein [Flavobacteriales bacterium]|jgi:uncharacterized membrane protein YfcA|nr:sulfite exporter TauE/SafE family protein [Flavobacteriales bacterium]